MYESKNGYNTNSVLHWIVMGQAIMVVKKEMVKKKGKRKEELEEKKSN